uniref:Venom protein family 6 protein 1 n=1 Tax=Pristhesancus plagipennis TaxID=1955184 RepID=A0A1Q1NPD1_PRIPG|nr:venom protein family 6 protein 1 [Pristhesancus plagipennis]
MMKFLVILAALCVIAQANKVDELKTKLNEYSKIIDGIRSEQIKRGIDIIVQKKQLAKEAKGDEAVRCVELEGNRYLLKLETNNVDSTEQINKKLQGYQDALKNGKIDEVETAVKDTLQKEVESVLTKLQAKGESITLEYVRIANKCRGV